MRLVISAVVISAVVVAVCAWQGSAAELATGVIRIEMTGSGADARTLDESVLMPISLQLNGIDDMSRIETEARSDGSGTVTVYFYPDTDLNLAEVRVQNRVNLALSRIPERFRQLPISVKRAPVGPPRFWFALTTPDPEFDAGRLKVYSMINLKPILKRAHGIAEARVVGERDFGMQVALHPDRLRAYDLTTPEVIDLIRRQATPFGAGGSVNGLGIPRPVVAANRLSTPDEFESLILRTIKGDAVRLKDVANVFLEAPPAGFTSVDGEPAALMALTPWHGRITAAGLLNEIRADDLQSGMSLNCVADRFTDSLLSVEVRLPGGAGPEMTKEVMASAVKLIRGLPGKPRVFAFADDHEPNGAMIYIKPGADDELTAKQVDEALAGITGAYLRTGEVAPGEDAFPIRIALLDPNTFKDLGEPGEQRFRQEAVRAIEKLAKDADVVAPAFSTWSAGQRAVDVERDLCAQHGVELSDVFTTLQVALGGIQVTDFYRFGRAYRVTVKAQPQFARFPEDLNQLRVRGKDRELIPLEKLIKFRNVEVPSTVVRVNGYRTLIITAAPAHGRTSAQVAAKCLKLVQEALPKGFRAMDLTEGGR